MKIALVILNWNGKQLLEKFLPVFVQHSVADNIELVVADNASTDDSVDFIKRKYPNIRLIENEENGGYAKGYNDALQYVNADIYGLINSDIEVTENWLNAIIQCFEQNDTTAIVQPKIMDYKNKDFFEYAGAAGGFIDKFGYPYCRGRIFSTLEKDTNQYSNNCDIFWASGACFFIRSEVFWSVGGFDADYFAHQEEIDLCWRVKNLEKHIKYAGKSVVYHVGGATLNESSPKKTYLNFRNSLYNLLKNLPKNKLFVIIFLRLILDGIAATKFLIQGKPKHFVAVIKAHFSFYKNFKKQLNKRNHLVKVKKYYNINSIVWQYFVLGKKKFSDLNFK
jgi:GT2 family glycosyltransferase